MNQPIITLSLPWPPSTNTYWRHPMRGKLAGRHLISEKGRAYREDVAWQVKSQLGAVKPLDGSLSVRIEAFMPDRRRRDLDNLHKSLLDSLTHAGVWLDDSQIDDLHIWRAKDERGELSIGGYVKLEVVNG